MHPGNRVVAVAVAAAGHEAGSSGCFGALCLGGRASNPGPQASKRVHALLNIFKVLFSE